MTRISSAKLRTITGRLLEWYRENARELPWRRTRDPYGIWVSEIMLQQTQVKTVIPYWERWMKALPTVKALARARPDKILKLWEGLGYYRRARHLHKAAQTIVTQFGGIFPRDFHDVLSLSGIGRYTAGAICSIAFNQATPILDGNVMRVLARLFAIQEPLDTPAARNALWSLAEQLVTTAGKRSKESDSEPHCSQLNQALMELGARICVPSNPHCDRCPIRGNCAARRRGLVDSLPVLPRKTPTSSRAYVALVMENNGKILIRQRPIDAVNGCLWEFPNREIVNGDSMLTEEWLKQWGVSTQAWFQLKPVKHAITRYRITVDVYACRLSSVSPTSKIIPLSHSNSRWVSKRTISSLAFTSAHRKILLQYLGMKKPKTGH